MIIISHRGYWLEPHEKNTVIAFKRSFNLGFGTETDVRDRVGELVISHDIPLGKEMTFHNFLTLHNQQTPLALNIKADGLATLVKNAMQSYNPHSWFVFDMSIPDMRSHLACGNPVFARVSEIESYPAYENQISGIWLDAFESDGWQIEKIEYWLKVGKRVCIVSPELHERDHRPLWHKLREQTYIHHPQLMMCTDYPEKAQQFFGASS